MVRIAGIQIAPIFLQANKTWKKLETYIREAKDNGANLATWGETLIPGYPFWLNHTNGAKFNDSNQKRAFVSYWQEALDLSNSEILDEMKKLAKELKIMLMGGIAEKSSGSTYCTLITIDETGKLVNRHRKIKPTFEERLIWADGDGIGLKTLPFQGYQIGGLNCWENWIPYARATLHKQNEMLHVAVWPGSIGLTRHITKFMALEGRSWIISTSNILRTQDFHELSEKDFPVKNLLGDEEKYWYNGGTVISDPKGNFVREPLIKEEGIVYADIDFNTVIEERQNFDYSGHYSRFDIFNEPLKI